MSLRSRVRRALVGAPKDVKDPHAFHRMSLVALLAWVGLGADGLSSSAYGPSEAYQALGSHTGLAVFLAIATGLTVLIISAGYSRIIEHFPSGGGGYVVASRLLGPRVGVISGSALLVDYVLTIAISLASGADAILSFLPEEMRGFGFRVALLGLVVLAVLNMRGVKESVTAIAPVFGVFLLTHAALLIAAFVGHFSQVPQVVHDVKSNIGESVSGLGMVGALALFVRAYSMGGGTYTGIEAVSNGVAMMREPRVQTAKRTMHLMAVSLAVTAAGILVCYLLFDVRADGSGRTLNAILLDAVAGSWQIGGLSIGKTFVIVALLSEGALLFVAAQAGFIDGPRVMANMASDSWLPHRFSALSDRLTMQNGVLLMAGAAAAALLYTGSSVSKLVVMYSINVFLTFSLSNIAMVRFWIDRRKTDPHWKRRLAIHVLGALLCLTILVVTIVEKFAEGGWITLGITVTVAAICFTVKRHYVQVVRSIRQLDLDLPGNDEPKTASRGRDELSAVPTIGAPDPASPVIILFVGAYGGLGRHALLSSLRMFPGHFKGVIFVSIAAVDSDAFKSADELSHAEDRTRDALDAYVHYAASIGLPAASSYSVGPDVPVEAEKLGRDLIAKYRRGLAVAGQLVFTEESAWSRLLHNETAFAIQRRLQHAGVPMIVVPVRLGRRAHKDTTVVVPVAP